MKYMNGILIITATILLTNIGISNAKINASFNCDKASQPVELAICSNEKLAKLDKEMALAYKNKKKSISSEKAKTLKKEQRSWLKNRISECNINKSNSNEKVVVECLINSYKSRINDIQRTDKQKLAFYTNSVSKSQFSLAERKKWKKLVNWPNSCEFDRLEYMSDSGLKFYNLKDNNYILRVMCERYAYQGKYKLYLINTSNDSINAVALNIPQLRAVNNKWSTYKSNNITGHFQYYKEDNTLLNIHKYSGSGQCGHSATYKIIINNGKVPQVKLNSAHGNNNCNKSMNEDQWPKIKLSELK